MSQGSYKKEPDWQSKADARLEKWLKDKKIDEKRRSDERRILLQKKGDSHEDQKHTNRQ